MQCNAIQHNATQYESSAPVVRNPHPMLSPVLRLVPSQVPLQMRDKEISGLSSHRIQIYDRFIKNLEQGLEKRRTAETVLNRRSSRSHCVVIIRLLQKYEPGTGKRNLESTIYLVDLAGSERLGKSAATGEVAAQGKKINQSLLTLGRVLNMCSSKTTEKPPVRDSILTRILSDSFGGNARTWMLACMSPTLNDCSESKLTLWYASSAKKIMNKARINATAERASDRQKVEQLRMELTKQVAGGGGGAGMRASPDRSFRNRQKEPRRGWGVLHFFFAILLKNLQTWLCPQCCDFRNSWANGPTLSGICEPLEIDRARLASSWRPSKTSG